jgi:hypothetical protein
MRYVERGSDGNIKGDYANPQLGYAEEAMPEDAAEFIAYKNRVPSPNNAAAMLGRQRGQALQDLDAAIAAMPAPQQATFRLIQQLLKD